MPNKYRTPYSRMIGALKNSAIKKHNAGWSRQIGSGFVEEDILDIQYRTDGLRFKFTWGSQTIKIGDLNLRETEEALKWTEKKEAQWEYNHRKEKGGW